MKYCFLTLACILIALVITAQDFKKLPGFGEVTKEELQMTECSFDKGAAAMVLFNEGETTFGETNYRFRIKIFNPKGFDYADVKIPFYSYQNSFNIIKLSAQTYNLDAGGNIIISKVEKASVFDKKLNKRFSEKSFAFPEVKSGSVIEYKYTLDNGYSGNWVFQKSIPVQYSRFIADFPTSVSVSAAVYCTLPVQTGSSEKKGLGNFKWFVMENLPALNDEPFMSCKDDYLQRLDLNIKAAPLSGIKSVYTWPEIVKILLDDEDFGQELKRNIPRTASLDLMLKGINEPFKKMAIIHSYVRENMEWNGYSNIWALDGVRSAWKDKKGTTGEINLILINLLKDAGLETKPLLVSTKGNGIINTAIAGFEQFDKVLAHVSIGDKYYVLDAADKATPSSLIPLDVMASEALLIAKPESYEWGWKTIWNEENTYNRTITLNAAADTLGNVKGMAKLVASGYDRCRLLPEGKKSIAALKTHFNDLKNIQIDSITVENAEIDTLPLTEQIYFESKGSSTGEYKYFSINLFTGLDKNPFLAEERATDVFFSANQKYEVNGMIFLPEGYILEEVPKSLKMITPDTSITFVRQATYNDGMINLRYQIEFKKPFFGKAEYPAFREFYKKLFELLNEQFVYRKK